MNIKNFKRLLRQKPGGRYSIRFFFTALPHLRASRVEIGLGTHDEAEAIRTAAVVLNTIYALSRFYGGKLCNRVFVDDDKNGVPLPDAQLQKTEPPKKRRKKTPPELPLFAPSTDS